MKQKKLVIYFITIASLLLAPIPILNTFILFMNGNVKLQSINKKNLFSTDNIERYTNYTVYKVFNKSLVRESVIAGKDDFLFLGNKYNNVLHKTNGTYRPSKKEIANWINKLKKLQQWYEDRGIKFVIVIAPNKHTIYKEKLPNWMSYNGQTITDDIVSYSNKKQINMLDLRSILIKEKEGSLLYPKHDTHWNNIGASITYNKTMDYLNDKYSINLKKIQFTISDFFRGASPLGGMMKIKGLINLDDNVYKYNFVRNEIILKNINKKNFTIEKKTEKITNKNIWTNVQGKNIFNSNAINNNKLLFLCDSMSATGGKSQIGNSILYNETFTNINKLHYSHITGVDLSKFIRRNKPDIVIYQIVERSLYNHGLTKDFPF